MGMSSNADDPGSSFDDAIASFGLDSPSRKAKTVGDRCIDILAHNIHIRGLLEEGYDGPWQRNAPSTIERKGRDTPNDETGAMLSENQLKGDVAVGHEEAVMAYGKDDENRMKAHYAHEGQSHLKIKRPFMGIIDEDADDIFKDFIEDFMAHMQRG